MLVVLLALPGNSEFIWRLSRLSKLGKTFTRTKDTNSPMKLTLKPSMLKPSMLVLALLISGMLSVSISYGQSVRTTTVTRRVGPTITTAPLRIPRPNWSWPSRLSQPRIQQPSYKTYWTNPNPDRKFPLITEQAVTDFLRRN